MIFKFRAKKKMLKKERKIRAIIWRVLIVLAIFIVLAIVTMSYGIYKLDWRSSFIDKILRVVPLPVAAVNGNFISYPDYLITLQAAERFYEKQKEMNFPGIPSQEEIKKMVRDRLIEDVLIKKIASQYNVSVTSQDIENKTNEIIQNKGSQADLEKFLKDYYGLNLAQYKEFFIEPNLYYSKTNEAIMDDETINGQAKKKIQEALNKIRNNEKFEEVAKQYSEDAKVGDNASQENFLRGELPKEIEDQLFSMKEGESTDVVEMSDSFQILKLVKKDEEKGVLTLQKIVVKIKTIDDLLKIEKEKAQIKIYAD